MARKHDFHSCNRSSILLTPTKFMKCNKRGNVETAKKIADLILPNFMKMKPAERRAFLRKFEFRIQDASGSVPPS